MSYFETNQQNPMQHPQQWGNPQMAQAFGQQGWGFGSQGQINSLGQPAYGQPFGQFGGQQFGQTNPGLWGQGTNWWGQGTNSAAQPFWGQPQRQLSHQDVGDVVRQLVPLLPQLLAQTQQLQGAIGYAAYGQPRQLTQQDVNEVVRQILPIVPQIVSVLQGQTPAQAAALYGGYGGWHAGQPGAPYFGQSFAAQNPLGQLFQQQPLGIQGMPGFHSAFGGAQGWGQQQRSLTQQDIGEVVRQLVGIIPQVMGNLQSFNQPRPV
jgi:hypothetical protein